MSEEQEPEKKIVIDSDWKEQVRQEKENLKGEAEALSFAFAFVKR